MSFRFSSAYRFRVDSAVPSIRFVARNFFSIRSALLSGTDTSVHRSCTSYRFSSRTSTSCTRSAVSGSTRPSRVSMTFCMICSLMSITMTTSVTITFAYFEGHIQEWENVIFLTFSHSSSGFHAPQLSNSHLFSASYLGSLLSIR